MTESKTTTVETTTDVEIPTVDERKLETYCPCGSGWRLTSPTVFCTSHAEAALRELAKGKTGEDNPRLFMVQSHGVPTDHKLANAKAS